MFGLDLPLSKPWEPHGLWPKPSGQRNALAPAWGRRFGRGPKGGPKETEGDGLAPRGSDMMMLSNVNGRNGDFSNKHLDLTSKHQDLSMYVESSAAKNLDILYEQLE